jgi:hypothetical protein
MVKYRGRHLSLSLSYSYYFPKYLEIKGALLADADPYCHGCYWGPELIPEAVGEAFPLAAAPLAVAVASVVAVEEVLEAAALLVAGNAENGNQYSVFGNRYSVIGKISQRQGTALS